VSFHLRDEITDAMSPLKLLGVSLVVLTVTGALAGPADAKISPRASAQAAAEGLIASYLPAGPGTTGICSSKTHGGFFDNNQSYLSSCASADGGFEVFAITNASAGSNLSLNSSYLQQQLNAACAAGASVFSAGIKGKVVQIFAGDGTEATLAQRLRDSYAAATQRFTGHASKNLACKR
jgi:hypothetical protein